ncbi:MAG: endopeptidase La [bacterium]
MTESTALQLRGRVPDELPAIPIKNAVVFPIPNLPVPLSVGRDRTLRAIEAAAEEAGVVFVVAQLDPAEEDPGPGDLYTVGTIARVLRMNRGTDAGNELLIEGIGRGRIEAFLDEDAFFRVRVSPIREELADDTETDALVRNLKEFATKVIQLTPRIPDEAVAVVEGIDNPSHLADLVASQLRLSTPDKQALLEITDVKVRLTRVIDHLAREAEVLEISNHIRTEVRGSLDKHQREVYLREQLRAIQRELGEDEEEDGDDLEERVEASRMPPIALKAARRELKRISRMNPQSAEYTVARSYVDWLLDVPWEEYTEDNLDIRAAEALLDRDHFGLEKVKRRIIEYLAVRKLKGDMKGPILCLVGPPGVGKTSLGKSVAEALGRAFVRLSLGGVRDEAEIRGHRRTYIGSLPGRFIKALKRAGTMNPVIVLDEIDKLGHDFRGDPASALLEVLDPEQNDSFSDHYLEVPVDLSKVLFITTANQLDPIPAPLRDRMEVIDIPGYIEEEKQEIARRHLVPRQLDDHGLTADQVTITDPALGAIINHYTREAGVRNLDRQIAGVLRSVARDVALGTAELPVTVDPDRVRAALGPQRIFPESKEDISTPGVAIGLAWTPVGGDILFIEATAMGGKAQLKLTGQLGEVMKESAHTALSFIHARAAQLGIPETAFSDRSIHLHLPSGAIPKDGPSAGVTIATALTSLLTGTPLRDALAMTGEITLRGVVLPVGGIKEKVLAAARAGMRDVILPRRNAGDLEEIPAHLRAEIRFHLVDRIEEVLKLALGIELSRSVSVLPPADAASA